METAWGRRALLGAAVTLLAALASVAPAAATPDRLELEGALHEHSGYSDGWPGSTPRTYFGAGRDAGLDFMGSADHSDNVFIPYTFSAYCAQDIDACREAGYDAVEIDNLDTWTRFARIDRDGAIALAREYVDAAHQRGLAIAQKNAAEFLGVEIGFDFASVESCAAYDECGLYACRRPTPGDGPRCSARRTYPRPFRIVQSCFSRADRTRKPEAEQVAT